MQYGKNRTGEKTMLRRIIQTFIVIIGILLFSVAYATTYYIDWETGDDNSNGTTKTTPWKRFPGMRGCWSTDGASVCNTKRAAEGVAGDRFIFKGGVTWPKEAFGIYFGAGTGTEKNKIYIGVDQTWHTGEVWSRPIFDTEGVETYETPSTYHNTMTLKGTWLVVDNIEFTGMAQLHGLNNGYGTAMLVFTTTASHSEVKNCYFHGWSHGATTDGYWDGGVDAGEIAGDGSKIVVFTSLSAAIDFGSQFHDNVIDGSDTTGDMLKAINGTCGHIYNNYIGYVVTAIIGVGQGYIWGNTFDHISRSSLESNCSGYFSYACVPGYNQHGNGIETYNIQYPIYNNLFNVMGGGANLIQYSTGNFSSYIFNNVIVDDGNQTMQISTKSLSPGDDNNWFIFNNTIQAINSNGSINGTTVPVTKFSTASIQNNHIISSPTGDSINFPLATTSLIQDYNFDHTLAQATSAGYVADGAYPFVPPVDGVTIGVGVNLSSITAAIPTTVISNAAAAALSDTSVGVNYDVINHRIIGQNRTPLLRGATWDIGAYSRGGISSPRNSRIIP